MRRIAFSIAAGAVFGLMAGRALAGLDVTPDLSGLARATQVPPASGVAPPATALDGTPGTSTAYARADHTHAARIQRTVMTTAADGTATFTFARPITVPSGQVPVIAYMVQDTGSPIIVQITGRTWTTANGLDTHTAVTIKAQRSRTLPAALSTLTGLVGYDIFGTAASGVQVNLFVADPTQ
ncbi:hypothetical protein [Methylobacterium persicinum]|uniref:Uncharacterized protein n=1 Tax=Methylobacterium persicinum TaxID=374426 RepID=A0ABU0HS98_9HYPH|nr:hypothetical protein [Methylobacterium persicinum]MDQ0445208.1 hypothetical protein [Methylobacterium persicinum]GJE37835.1 hypothetical protein KHHGKMAE_1897 [Methylobacterium persicinum]